MIIQYPLTISNAKICDQYTNVAVRIEVDFKHP